MIMIRSNSMRYLLSKTKTINCQSISAVSHVISISVQCYCHWLLSTWLLFVITIFLNNCNCYCLAFSQSLVFGPLWSLVRHVRVMACVPCGHAFARPDPTCLNVNGRYCHNCQCSVLSVLCSILYCCGDLSNVRLHLQLDLDQDPGTGSLA